MRLSLSVLSSVAMTSLTAASVLAQGAAAPADTLNDPVRIMVSQLTLDRYKNTVKGLTQFGDRRQGTEAQS